MKREGDLRSGTEHFMATQVLQFSPGALRYRLVALWNRCLRISRRTPKSLRLCASLPLGERRFVAVVEFEEARFLLGGTSSSLVLLARLADSGSRTEDDAESDSRGLAAEKSGKNRNNITRTGVNRGNENQGNENRAGERGNEKC